MKRLLLLMASFALVFSLKAQVTLYEDDFEAYTVGQGIASQSSWWIVWPGGPDAPITTEQAQSGTKSVKISGSSDIIWILDKVSGKYQVDFHYYVLSGFAGYFNFQRLPQPGVEWVTEVYFNNNGTGIVHAGGQNTATFNYVQNQWVHVKHIIDIDSDWAEMYLDDVLIHAWQWSLDTYGQPSPHGPKLGGVNVYAGAPTGQTPNFYMDDVAFIELTTGTLPAISVTPDHFQKDIVAGQVVTDNINVENVGEALLNYQFEVNYIFPDSKNRQVLEVPEFSGTMVKNLDGAIGFDPNATPGSHTAPQPEQVTLNYDGPNATGIGLNSPAEWELAARFTNDLTVPHAGMELTQVEVYIYHVDNCSFKLRVYGEGTSFAPGDLLVDQPFNPVVPGWMTINLTTPVLITGEDLWVGYWIDQTLEGIFPAGADAGPAHPNGDFIKIGAGWGHNSLDRNWNVRGILEGDSAPNWLTISPPSGALNPAQTAIHGVNFDGSILFEGDYEAVIKVRSNDPDNPLITVPVDISVSGSPEQPAITVNPSSLNQELLVGQTATQQLNVGNVGQMPLTFSVEWEFLEKGYTIHPVPEGKTTYFDIDMSQSPELTNGGQPENYTENDPVVLNYDGPNASAVGLTDGGTFNVAARFPSAMVAPYEYYMLESVEIYINDLPTGANLKIWGAGTSTSPGAVIHQQPILPVSDSWITVELTNPVMIDGTDIWIGYDVTHGAGQFPAGVDAGPANVDGAWISIDGIAWNRLYELAPTLNYNWNIRGTLYPGEIPWLNVSPVSGIVPGSSSTMLDVVFNATSLDLGVFNANILISSNDPDNPVVTVPVQLDVTGAPTQPTIEVDPEELFEELQLGTSSEQILNISNVGMQQLTFNLDIAIESKNSIPHRIVPAGVLADIEAEVSMKPDANAGGEPNSPEDGVVLNYDGPNNSAIGLTDGGTMWVAARFPADMVSPYAYYTLETVEVYVNDLPSATTLFVWSAGTSTAPGAILHEQTFVPVNNDWNTISLSTPVVLDGNDIWIGYNAVHGPGQFPAGCDAGPAHPEGAYISTNGVAWSKLFELAPTLDFSWNIRGTIFPGVAPWLMASPTSGTVAGGATLPVTVSFDATNLDFGTYNANILINSNDPASPLTTVPVQLIVEGTPDYPSITVTPAELNVAVQPDQVVEKELVVGNDGDADLVYTAEVQYMLNAGKDAVVFFEGFEGVMFPPAGWAKINPDGGTGWTDLAANTTPLPGWQGGNADPAPEGGNKMAFCTWTTGGATANDQWLVTPQFTMAAGMELSFYMRYWPTTYADQVQIRISTTAQNNVNAFSIIVDDIVFGATSPDTWQLYSYELDEFLSPGQTFYIGFREFVADNFDDGAAIFLDNISLSLSMDWLSISPTQGTVVPGGEDVVTVTLNAEGLEMGDYAAMIRFLSNDPNQSVLEVPVTMSVNILSGDSNCDGEVNILDAVTTISYILFANPEPFCFEEADVVADGIINILDVVGTINIVLQNKTNVVPGLVSAPAHMHLNQNSIELQSDGTLAGLQFEIAGLSMEQINLAIEGYEFVGAVKDGVLTGLLFSFDNTPLPAGSVKLFDINSDRNHTWGEIVAANVNAEQVDVLKYQENVFVAPEFTLSVFPNPAKDHLTVQANQTIDFIRMTNQLGQVVEERMIQLENTVINTSTLRSGLYILEVYTQDNITIQKIVIE
ncbi:MAG TPA: T9SS type A sorting domain-containing protein [Bacteroidales bacterium]|nr:T9SS type A sorting domain-containing protein [Bacteroidales bacterium]